jgi:hypothetical protein
MNRIVVVLSSLLGFFLCGPISAQPLPAAEVSISFGTPSIPLNGSTSLCSSVSNPLAATITGVGVTISLPAGLVITGSSIGVPPQIYNFGGGGTFSITSNSIVYAGLPFTPEQGSYSGCVTVTGTTAGAKVVTTSTVTSNQGTGAAQTATLDVIGPQPEIPVPALDYWVMVLLAAMIAFAAYRYRRT